MRPFTAPTYKPIIAVVLFALFSTASQALDVWGGHIGWECVGKDSFKIELTAYRDCNGTAFSSPSLNISTNCGTQNLSLAITSKTDATPVCPTQCTRCASGSCTFNYGIEEIKASAILDVSSYRNNGCCELTVAYNTCCRPYFSKDIFYIESRLNLCQSPCDNAPIIDSKPLTIACLGRDLIISQQAPDPDGDSLTYKLVDARGTGTSSIYPRSTGYSGLHPLHYLGFPKNNLQFPRGFHLNDSSGQMMFRPMKEEVSTIALQIESYRKGKSIGYITKDIAVVVIKCPDNNPPVLSGIKCAQPVASSFIIEACPGKEICFDVCTSEKDKDDSVRLEWNKGIPEASFTIKNPTAKLQNGTFCWTPEKKHVSNTPHTFTVRAYDNACPVEGVAHRTYSIIVKDAAPSVTVSDTVDSCGQVELRAQLITPGQISNYTWTIDGKTTIKSGSHKADTLQHSTAVSGQLPYELTVVGTNGCSEKLKRSINVPKHVALDINDTIICVGDSIRLLAKAIYPQGAYFIHWGSTDTTFNASAPYRNLMGHRDSAAMVTINDGYCEFKREVSIEANTKPYLSMAPSIRACDNKSIDLVARASSGLGDPDSVFNYKWYLSGNSTSLGNSDTLQTTETGNYLLAVSDSLGCTTIDSTLVYKDTAWIPLDTEICLGDSLTIQLPSDTNMSNYLWSDNPKDTGLVDFRGTQRTLSPATSRYYYLRRVYQVQGATCTTYDSFSVSTRPLPTLSLQPKNLATCPKGSISLTASPAGGTWTGPGIPASPTTANASVDSLAAGVYKYVYLYTDSNGCSNIDSSTIAVLNQPKAAYTVSNRVIGIAQSAEFISTSSNAQNSTVQWLLEETSAALYSYSATGDTASILFSDPGFYDLEMIVRDTPSGCSDTLTEAEVLDVFVSTDEVKIVSTHVYPNPASNGIWIEINQDQVSGQFQLFSTTGQLLSSRTLNKQKEQLDITSLPNGIYHWKLITGKAVSGGNLIVQRSE